MNEAAPDPAAPAASTARTLAGVPRSEFSERVDRARDLASERELEGLVVIGRGGGPYERHGDLLYLTGHYPTFSGIVDQPPHWRMRGEAAAVIDSGLVTLITDGHVTEDEIVADELRTTTDLPATLEEVLSGRGLTGRRLGLVGSEAMSGPQLEYLLGRFPSLERTDDLLGGPRSVKSPAEQEILRRAGQIGSHAIGTAIAAVDVGATAQEIAALAAHAAISRGAAVANVFADVFGPSRPPGRRPHPSFADPVPMREGDIFVIDMSGSLDGYFWDFSRTRVAGGDVHHGREAFEIARATVNAATEALVPGRTIGEVTELGFEVERSQGKELLFNGFDGLGHGLGLGFEEPWMTPDNETVIEPGMCIAVERLVMYDEIGASFEHNVIVTDDGPEILDSTDENYES